MMIERYDKICHILMNSDEYMAIARPDNTVKYINDSFRKLLDPGSTVKDTSITIQHLLMKAAESYSRWKENEGYLKGEFRLVCDAELPGGVKWISWKITPILDDEGNLVEMLIVGQDMTENIELKREKDKVLDTLFAFKRAIDTHIICTITDRAGKITYANEKFCTVSQYSSDELIGKTHNIVNSGYHPKDFFIVMWQTIIKGESWTGEIRNKAKDGTYYWVESVIIPIKNKHDHIEGFVSLRILINEQKRLEAERNAHLQLLQNMLFTVSHEIRRPITNCEGLLHILKDEMPASREEYDEAISHLLHSVIELDLYSRSLNDKIHENIPGKNTPAHVLIP